MFSLIDLIPQPPLHEVEKGKARRRLPLSGTERGLGGEVLEKASSPQQDREGVGGEVK